MKFTLFFFIPFYLIFRTFGLTALDFSTSKFCSFSSIFFPYFMSEPPSFVFLFQNQVLSLFSVTLISAVPSLLSFISRCVLKTKLALDFLFLQAWTVTMIVDSSRWRQRLDNVVRLGKEERY